MLTLSDSYTIKELYSYGYNILRKSHINNPEIDIVLILSHILNKDKVYIYTYPEKRLNKEQILLFFHLLHRRMLREPLPYILGEKEFFGLKFKVNTHTLIPRHETELIVEEVMKEINNLNNITCADIGTGCGNIAICIAYYLKDKNIKIYATDINKYTLKTAEENAKLHKVEKYINFCHSNLFEYFINNNIKLDMIVSNPPYVTEKEYRNLSPEIYFEPKEALVMKSRLGYYEYFAENAKKVLTKKGKIVLEINPRLLDKICHLFIRNEFKIKKIIYDYNSFSRGIVIQN